MFESIPVRIERSRQKSYVKNPFLTRLAGSSRSRISQRLAWRKKEIRRSVRTMTSCKYADPPRGAAPRPLSRAPRDSR